MEEDRDQGMELHRDSPGWMLPALVLLGIVAVAALAFGWVNTSRIQQSQQALSTQIKTLQQNFALELDTLRQRQTQMEAIDSGLQSDIGVVTKRLRLTQSELKKARDEARAIRDESSQQLAALDTSVKSELATKASSDDLKAVDGRVTGVSTDLDATKNDLKMARSELGTLIARNHEEVEELRRLGERDYIEFTLAAKNKPQKVGNVTVELRGTNPKKHLFSVALVVEDLRVLRKNRVINEPIFFYMHGSKQPLELVINQVGKNKVSGYLSIPKAGQTAAGD